MKFNLPPAMPSGVAVFLCALLLAPTCALAGKPIASVPANANTVIEILPRGYSALAGRPAVAGVSLDEVARLLELAARTGDSRLAARADGLLAGLPSSDRRPVVLRARAFSAQHRHDFKAALSFLDGVVAQQPRDADARLARAYIHLVQGEVRRARAECTALALGIDADRAMVCLAALSLHQGKLRAAASAADRWLGRAPADHPLRGHMLAMRGEIASRARAGEADGWFRKALAVDPGDVRVMAAYARHLRRNARHREVLALLPAATASDGLQLLRALAARATGASNWPALAKRQGRRYALTRSLGSTPELRDEAEYFLSLANDPLRARRLAVENFRTQRDYEDVDLLLRANAAAQAKAAP